jgi:SAM-dependent methyltransferase
LAHPLTRDLSIDSPQTTELRREIIRSKPFLKQIYEEWCAAISRWVPDLHGGILELGSGGGILADHIQDVITSEVFPCKGVRLVADARTLPLASSSIRAIVLIDVLHHIPQVRHFFSEAARCLAPGGAVIMLEPMGIAVVDVRIYSPPSRAFPDLISGVEFPGARTPVGSQWRPPLDSV